MQVQRKCQHFNIGDASPNSYVVSSETGSLLDIIKGVVEAIWQAECTLYLQQFSNTAFNLKTKMCAVWRRKRAEI